MSRETTRYHVGTRLVCEDEHCDAFERRTSAFYVGDGDEHDRAVARADTHTEATGHPVTLVTLTSRTPLKG